MIPRMKYVSKHIYKHTNNLIQHVSLAGISPMHYDADRAVCLASMISDNMLPVMVYALVFIVVPMGTIIGQLYQLSAVVMEIKQELNLSY